MRAIPFTIFMLIWALSFGQASKTIDSLSALLHSNIADTLKVRILYKISDAPMALAEQLAYVDRGVKLSTRIGFERGRLEGIFKQTFKNSTLGNWAKGLESAFQGYYEALKVKNIDYEVNFMNMIAMSYQKQKNYEKALYWSNRAIEKIKRGYRGSGVNIWAAYHQSAAFYAELNLPDSAILCADKSIEAGLEAKILPALLGYSYEYKGDAYVKKKEYDLALKNYNTAIEHLKDDPFSVQEVERQMAQMYMLMNNLPLAEKYALQAYNGALNTSNPNVLVDVCEILVRIYEPVSKEKAYPFLRAYQTLRDSLFSQEYFNQVYQIEFNNRQKEEERKQAIKVEQDKAKVNMLVSLIGFMLLLSVILGYFFYQKQIANKLLLQQKEELNQKSKALTRSLDTLQSTQAQLIQAEKLASLGELTAGIAHEIQNPLNFVNNFAEVSTDLLAEMNEELDKGDTQEAKAIAADLVQNLQKINHHGQRASSIVKGMLEHSRASTGQKEPTDLNKLADEYLRLAYHGLRAKDSGFNCQLEANLDPQLPKVAVIPQDIGRVFLNLINNALYAVQEKAKMGIEGYEPKVSISSALVDGQVELRVQDNGLGIPEGIREKIFQPFFTTKPTGQGTGLGLSLAYDIVVKGHGGNLDVQSKEGEGTLFVIQLSSK